MDNPQTLFRFQKIQYSTYCRIKSLFHSYPLANMFFSLQAILLKRKKQGFFFFNKRNTPPHTYTCAHKICVIYAKYIKYLHEKNSVLSSPKESDGRQRFDEESGYKKREKKLRNPFGVFPILSVNSFYLNSKFLFSPSYSKR